MRQLAVGAALVLLTFALGDAVAPWLAIAALVVGGIVTVADNGLAFTAVAEIAGTGVVGPGAGRAEHRAEHRRVADADRARRPRRSGGLRGRVRGGRRRAGGRDRPHSCP